MDKAVSVVKPLEQIITTVTSVERELYSIEFIFRDGTRERLGKRNQKLAGDRSQAITFGHGEMLVGCVLHHAKFETYGIQWITGRY